MEKLADPANYSVDPDKAWQRIKVPTRKLDVLGRLQSLAAWREREARQKNLPRGRSEEHTSELQSLMRISYAVFCLKKKNNTKNNHTTYTHTTQDTNTQHKRT